VSSLWELGSKGPLSTFIYPTPVKSLAEIPQPKAETEAGPSRPSTPITNLTSVTHDLQIEPADQADSSEPEPEGMLDLNPSEISTLLYLSLLQALQNIPQSTFPLPASLLYSAHILANRPAYIPESQRAIVVIGHSEWKKLGKWMKEASKEGLLKVKENKGEFIIQGLAILLFWEMR
jgi:translation initiation factor 2D